MRDSAGLHNESTDELEEPISIAENISEEPSTIRFKRIRSLRNVSRGDEIEARRGNTIYYQGQVQETAPGLGTVWIKQAADGARRALSQDDYTFWKTAR
ncbi:hypothetical protein [Arthrobacter castelli]|uniref:hypothetical protein n=1 Tax=Arthrobacter castelli TaxID=271431 RepID=UPI00041DF70A|nr:hypothetical protein [Arthrobacter castelli]